MKRSTVLTFLVWVAVVAATATAQPSLRSLENFQVESLSADGRAAAGVLTANFETARWSDDLPDTVIALGRETWTTVGFAGKIDISADGQHVSASVATDDSLMTWGLWSKGTGWLLAMPPLAPGGTVSDRAYGQAGTWTEQSGVVEWASPGQSRPNGIDNDGDVMVGWAATPGARLAAVWDAGILTMIASVESEAYDVSADGALVVGRIWDEATQLPTAALWTRGGGTWDLQLLGTLPGTQPNFGQSRAENVSDDGGIVVGYNRFGGFSTSGIVWTATLGLMKADDFVRDVLGLSLPEGYTITRMTAVSRDGRTIAGYGNNPYDVAQPVTSFIITMDGVAAVPGAPAAGGLSLEGNHPNPFNPTTSIALSLDRATRVRLEIFDVRGRLVRMLHDGDLAAGTHDLPWNGCDDGGQAVASGVYLARARGDGGRTASHRMTLLK